MEGKRAALVVMLLAIVLWCNGCAIEPYVPRLPYPEGSYNVGPPPTLWVVKSFVTSRQCEPPLPPVDPIAFAEEVGLRIQDYRIESTVYTGRGIQCGDPQSAITAYIQIPVNDEKRAEHNGFELAAPPPLRR